MRYIGTTESGVEIRIKVSPRSSKSEVVGISDDRLRIKLNSPPVDGAANKELIKLLSKIFGVAKSSLELVRGDKSRLKTVLVRGKSADEIKELLRGSC